MLTKGSFLYEDELGREAPNRIKPYFHRSNRFKSGSHGNQTDLWSSVQKAGRETRFHHGRVDEGIVLERRCTRLAPYGPGTLHMRRLPKVVGGHKSIFSAMVTSPRYSKWTRIRIAGPPGATKVDMLTYESRHVGGHKSTCAWHSPQGHEIRIY